MGDFADVEHDSPSFTGSYSQDGLERLKRSDIGCAGEGHDDGGTVFDGFDLKAHEFLPEAVAPSVPARAVNESAD